MSDSVDVSRASLGNSANEIVARDHDGDGSPDVYPELDGNGSLVNDGEGHGFVYDSWGRVTAVTLHGDLLSIYRYNALGHRIWSQWDRDRDGQVDEDGDIVEHCYNEKWQKVADFHSGSAVPHAEYLYRRKSWLGGDEYAGINAVMLREGDVDGDGVFEGQRWMCTDKQHSVVAIVSELGWQVEQVRYDTYGTPFGLPAGDINSDGRVDGVDLGMFENGMAYDVKADIDLDGDVDSRDQAILLSVDYRGRDTGEGVLSGLGENEFGFQGMMREPNNVWYARYRYWLTNLGIWGSRDPLGFVDGNNLLELVRSNPLAHIDPLGLSASGGSAGDAGEATEAVCKAFPPSLDGNGANDGSPPNRPDVTLTYSLPFADNNGDFWRTMFSHETIAIDGACSGETTSDCRWQTAGALFMQVLDPGTGCWGFARPGSPQYNYWHGSPPSPFWPVINFPGSQCSQSSNGSSQFYDVLLFPIADCGGNNQEFFSIEAEAGQTYQNSIDYRCSPCGEGDEDEGE